MKYDDDHSRRKAAIEDALNAAAGDDEIARLRSELGKALATCALLEHTSAVVGEEQIKGLAKVAREAFWSNNEAAAPSENVQCLWVNVVKAVLQAAGRVEVLPADSSDTSR